VRRSTARQLLSKSAKFRVSSKTNASWSFAHLSKDLKLGAPRSSDALPSSTLCRVHTNQESGAPAASEALPST
jgi:hypothetical protein